MKLRVTKVKELIPAAYTLFCWEVNDIDSTIKALLTKEINFEKFNGFPQNALGVCTFPDGGKVAWFKDSDGNTLSITQFVKKETMMLKFEYIIILTFLLTNITYASNATGEKPEKIQSDLDNKCEAAREKNLNL